MDLNKILDLHKNGSAIILMEYEQTSERQTSVGQTSAGQTSDGQASAGQTSVGQTSERQTSDGQTSAGQTSVGQTSDGQTSAGQTSAGQTSAGQPVYSIRLIFSQKTLRHPISDISFIKYLVENMTRLSNGIFVRMQLSKKK